MALYAFRKDCQYPGTYNVDEFAKLVCAIRDGERTVPSPASYVAIGQRMRSAREAMGMSQEVLGAKLGVTGATISRYESAESRIPIPDLQRVAEILEVTTEYLLTGEGRPSAFPRRDLRSLLRQVEAVIQEEEQRAPILIPEREWPISAGPGVPAEQELWPYWPGPGERGHEFTVVRVTGTCMEPRIREGERVVVDTSASHRPGDIVAAEHDGERLVKRLESHSGDLWLVALQGQPPIKVDERTRIIGVVRMVMHRP